MTQNDRTLKPKPLELKHKPYLRAGRGAEPTACSWINILQVKQHSYVLASLDLHFLFNSLITPCKNCIHFGM